MQIVYDGDGNKAAETVARNGVTTATTYLVDDQNPTGYVQVVEEKTNGTLTRVYAWVHELICEDQISASEVNPTWSLSCYGYDGHGDVRFLVDAPGRISGVYDFDGFGSLIGVAIGINGLTTNSHLYCGEQFDDALGQYFLRARLMNPLTGRFWTMDLWEGDAASPNGIHKYTYCGGCSVLYADPSGMYASLAETSVVSAIEATLVAVGDPVGINAAAQVARRAARRAGGAPFVLIVGVEPSIYDAMTKLTFTGPTPAWQAAILKYCQRSWKSDPLAIAEN